MKQNIFAFLIFFVLFPSLGYGQQQLIDSLRNQTLRSDITPEKRVMVLADLGLALRYKNIAEATKIGEEAIRQSWPIKDKQYASYAWSRIYPTYRKADSTALVLVAIDSCKWYAEKSKNKFAMGNALRVAGNYADYQNDDVKATEYFLEALDLLENSGQTEELASICYALAGGFATSEDLNNSEKYARLSLQITDAANDPSAKCLSSLAMATFYEDKYLVTNQRELLDSAIYYIARTVRIFEQHQGVIKSQFTGETAAMNYAAYLWRHFPDTPKDTVFALLNKAIVWSNNINDQAIIAGAYGLMSEYLSNDGKYEEAETVLLSSLAILQNQPSPNYFAINNMITGLIRISEKMGDKDRIIKYYKLYIDCYKKLYDSKRMSQMKVLEATFNHQKKEQEIKALQNQASLNRKINVFSIGIALLSIVGLIFIFMSYHLKLKSANQQKELLEIKAKDAETQKLLKEEETRRLELEQILINQEKEQLQKEVFAGAVQLKQKNELLKTVRDEVANDKPIRRIDRIIKENLQVDDSFNEYKSMIRKTHPHFFNLLQERAQRKLTDLDLKYCTYIYLNIPAKQMAGMLHVEYSTIRMNKHRLKQKFNLVKEEDLDLFIKGIA